MWFYYRTEQRTVVVVKRANTGPPNTHHTIKLRKISWHPPVAPVVQLVTSKPCDVGTRVRISMQSHELRFFLTKNKKIEIKKMSNKWRTINSSVHKIRLHGRRGKGTAESFSREKLRQAPQKEGGETSCLTFILCDPGWYIQKPDVQNKGDDNTHTPYWSQ